ncbi:hypothetical protein ACT3CD_05190 [Geofilum sp. OHC36d9]|uniref:hypothetical protein n=1 Tax=Geofilum sp. OHC36d9 TaxID=3458413 RepID=UPI004034536E
MENKFETEKGEVYIYNDQSKEPGTCACGGNCGCKDGTKQEPCSCGGTCNCQ